ncbi:MAG: alkaline phosphatase family protein [Planctomycetota bacterium]
MNRIRVILLFAAAFATLPILFAQSSPALPEDARIVVIGVDGLDHGTLQTLMKLGQLPAFEALSSEGTCAKLATTEPAQSPVSWSSLITGLNPDRTGIDGFLRRRFRNGEVEVELSLANRDRNLEGFASRSFRRWTLGFPMILLLVGGLWQWRRRRRFSGGLALLIAAVLAMTVYYSETALPDGIPRAENARQGDAYWDLLDELGVSTATVLAPCSFPVRSLENGRLVAGFGVPDVRGTPGFWTLYRNDVAKPSFTETGGRIRPLFFSDPSFSSGPFQDTVIEGPPDIVIDDGSASLATLQFKLRTDPSQLTARCAESDAEVSLNRGQWSAPLALTFRMSSLVALRGFVRLKWMSTLGQESDEKIVVYADPVFFDVDAMPPGVPISTPADYASQLKKAVGIWETTGWAVATNALKDRMIDTATFMEDAHRVWDDQESLAVFELAQRSARVVTTIFTVPDRVQHMMAGRAEEGQIAEEVADAYRRIDAFIARVKKDFSKPGDVLLVVSDHGFAPWRRAVNLNRLLKDAGLLVLKRKSKVRNLHDNLQTGVAFDEVDWSKTKAYSLGLGKIYLNLRGREPQGIVEPSDTELELRRIEELLSNLRDGAQPVVATMSRGAEIYPAGAIPHGPADIYVGFHRGYRVSWQTCLGGADEPVIFDNDSPWSADHCGVSPSLVPGVIASNLKLKSEAKVTDLVPTLLAILRQPLPISFNGTSLLK